MKSKSIASKLFFFNFSILSIIYLRKPLYVSEPPEIPQFVLTYDIVEGHASRDDRLSFCTADVGYPPGHIVIYSDIYGEMTELLSSDQQSNEIASKKIYKASNDGCSETWNVTFAFDKVQMNINRKNIWCIVMPNIDYVGGQPVQSKDETIKVVPSRFLLYVNIYCNLKYQTTHLYANFRLCKTMRDQNTRRI